MILDDELLAAAARAGRALVSRQEKVAVCESAAGGLVCAALLAVPGASAFCNGGLVVYTASVRALLASVLPPTPGLRGATEEFARYEAEAAVLAMRADWGVGETGAAGPTANPYGDPAGHAWVAVARAGVPGGPTRQVLTGSADRLSNMAAFATQALQLLAEAVKAA